jgi:CheY-like chemotaxis protein
MGKTPKSTPNPIFPLNLSGKISQGQLIPILQMANTPYIALADDDADDQEMLAQRILKNHPGIPFKFFKDGQEITRYLETCPTPDLPALLILDYKMPIQTGADVLKTLQTDNRYKSVRKIVWSTSGNKQFVSECMQYGAERYFSKPDSIQQLDDIVNQISDILHAAHSID